MKIEFIFPQYAMKEIVHVTSSGMQKIPVNLAKNENLAPYSLAYVEKYTSENGFKLLNEDQDKLYICKE